MRGHCAVVGHECEAPTGYAIGGRGRAALPQQTGLLRCGYCEDAVCRRCSTEVDGRPVCLNHQEEELAIWIGLSPHAE